MADVTPAPDDYDAPTERDRPPGAPMWVKVLGLIALVGILLAAGSLLLGVQHGPGLHEASSIAPWSGLRHLIG